MQPVVTFANVNTDFNFLWLKTIFIMIKILSVIILNWFAEATLSVEPSVDE